MKRSIEVRSCVPVKFRVKVKSTLSPTSYFCDFKLLKDVSSFVVVSFCWAMSILPFTVNSPLMAANVLNPCEKRRCPNHIHKIHHFIICRICVIFFSYFYSIIKRKLTSINCMHICLDLFVLFCLTLLDWVFFLSCLYFVNFELVVIKNGDAVIPIIFERIFYHFALMLHILFNFI